MGSTTDKVKGVTNEAVGKAKQSIGEAVGSDRLQGEVVSMPSAWADVCIRPDRRSGDLGTGHTAPHHADYAAAAATYARDLRRTARRPTRPRPNRPSVAGSGTGSKSYVVFCPATPTVTLST